MKIDINHSNGTDEVNFYRLKPPPPDVALAANGETLYAGIISSDDSLASHWHIYHNEVEQAVAKSKIPCNLILSADSVVLDENNLTQTIIADWTGNGNLTVTSSNSNIASVSVSGNTVTLTGGKNTGIVAIVFIVNETSNYTSEIVQITGNVTSSAYKPLNECTPQEIQTTVRKGVADKIWDVGDVTSEITLTKTLMGRQNTSNVGYVQGNYYAYVLGFNHNASVETNGNYSLHLCLGASNFDSATHKPSKEIAFNDGIWDGTEVCGNSGNNWGFCHQVGCTRSTDGNSYSGMSNSGGWSNSFIRNTILPKFFSAMPQDWQNVISTVCKQNTTGNSYDTLFLLSEYEVFGNAEKTLATEGEQYDYYKNGNSARRIYATASSMTNYWWLRSKPSNSTQTFCAVNYQGNIATKYTYWSLGVVPCFVIS